MALPGYYSNEKFFFVIFIFTVNLFSAPAFSAVIPFEVDYAKVRLPSGYSSPATPAFKNLSTAASAGGAAVNGSQVVQLGKAAANIPLSKAFSVANIAKSAAGAILNKTAVGAIAALALPYAIDAATDLYIKQVPGETTSPVVDTQYIPNGLALSATAASGTYYTNCGGTRYHTTVSTLSTLGACILHAQNPNVNVTGGYLVPGTGSSYTLKFPYGAGTMQIFSNSITKNTDCSGFGAGYSYDNSTSSCKSTPGCTSPSTYDTVTGMCIGSAINEPANKTQLEQDIADSLGNTPAAAPIILDDLLANDVLPESTPETTEVGDIMPEPIQGPLETALKHFFDPATGHPMVESTSKDTKFKFEKTAPNEVTVKPETTTEITTIDEVTNETTTVTNTVTNTPEPVPTEAPQTDCEKFPDAVGCLKLGDVTNPESIPPQAVSMSLISSSWGSGSCPADVSVAGHFLSGAVFSFAPVCQFLSTLAPVLIAIGWLISGWFVVGGVKD